MAMSDTIDKVKFSLRITSNAFNDDVNDCIESCLADLEQNGIVNPDEAHPLILNAIKLYCKAHLIEDMDVAEKYQARYDSQKACLMMSEGFGL